MSGGIELAAANLRVDCSLRLFDTLVGLAEASLPAEMAGLLLGSVDPAGERVKVFAHHVLEGFEATRWSLRLPASAWIKADWAIRQAHPELRMVGWFHTHPGHGIFLSSQDWDLHLRKFAPAQQPWASAWVLDPVQRQWGAYFATGESTVPQPLHLQRPVSPLRYTFQTGTPAHTNKEASNG